MAPPTTTTSLPWQIQHRKRGRQPWVCLPIEVFEAIKSRVGADFAVGCRFLSDEIIEGGSDLDDAVFFVLKFADVGMDFLFLSRGESFKNLSL